MNIYIDLIITTADAPAEAARILRETADKLEEGAKKTMPLWDSTGRLVGELRIFPSSGRESER